MWQHSALRLQEVKVASSYSDLHQYRACPRLFGFKKLGYISPKTTEPLATGGLAHIGIAAHFKGQDVEAAIDKAIEVEYSVAVSRLDGNERGEYEAMLVKAKLRAKQLLKRYIPNWAKDYKAILVEPELRCAGVVCHPDLVAIHRNQRVIVDYKTSYHPDERWYDISGQTDLYAFIVGQLGPTDDNRISLIIYDTISEEGIFRHMRPPRLAAGKRLFGAVQELDKLVTKDNSHNYPVNPAFLADPHPDYTCPSRCNFFTPCWLLDTGSWEDCRDYLEENYLKEEWRRIT